MTFGFLYGYGLLGLFLSAMALLGTRLKRKSSSKRLTQWSVLLLLALHVTLVAALACVANKHPYVAGHVVRSLQQSVSEWGW